MHAAAADNIPTDHQINKLRVLKTTIAEYAANVHYAMKIRYICLIILSSANNIAQL